MTIIIDILPLIAAFIIGLFCGVAGLAALAMAHTAKHPEDSE